jgi:hypothetical protein
MSFKENYNLNFISYDNLYEVCKSVIDVLDSATDNIDKKLHKNIIDPFSAVFEASFHNISLAEWLKMEKSRQIQKTFQNKVGDFHQMILGKCQGWENLKSGKVIDLLNREKKIIAEIKNKYNTTKGNQKIRNVDGATFYEIATGERGAISKLYNTIPFIIADIRDNNVSNIVDDPLFLELFQKSFK